MQQRLVRAGGYGITSRGPMRLSGNDQPVLRAGRWAAFLGRNELGGGRYTRAMLVLQMEAAAARRRQGHLPAQSWWGRVTPGQGGWRDEDPPGDAVLLTPVPMRPTTPEPRGTQLPAENFPRQPDSARYIFELRHRWPGLKRHRSPQNQRTARARTQNGIVVEPLVRAGGYGITFGEPMRHSGNDAGPPEHMDQALQRLFSLSTHSSTRLSKYTSAAHEP